MHRAKLRVTQEAQAGVASVLHRVSSRSSTSWAEVMANSGDVALARLSKATYLLQDYDRSKATRRNAPSVAHPLSASGSGLLVNVPEM